MYFLIFLLIQQIIYYLIPFFPRSGYRGDGKVISPKTLSFHGGSWHHMFLLLSKVKVLHGLRLIVLEWGQNGLGTDMTRFNFDLNLVI